MIACKVVRETMTDQPNDGRFVYDDLGVCEFVVVPRIGERISVPMRDWDDQTVQVVDVYHRPLKAGVTGGDYRIASDDEGRPSVTILVDRQIDRKRDKRTTLEVL